MGAPGPRIGAPMTMFQHVLPSALRKVQAEHPQCGLRVETGDNPQLLLGKIDLAVMVEADLVFDPLFKDELKFLMRPAHAWANGRAITMARFKTRR